MHSAGLEGEGERVALIEIDGFKLSDIQGFATCFHLPVPKISAYGVGIGKALPDGGESTLDLELLDATAPDLAGVDVYESQARRRRGPALAHRAAQRQGPHTRRDLGLAGLL